MDSDAPYKNWPHAVLIAIDQLGNALAGGHPVTTISARVGYFSANADTCPFYWKWLETIIDFAFYPIDGSSHCYKAWQNDEYELFRIGNDVTRIILSSLIVLTMPLVALFTRLAVIFKPSWRFMEQDKDTRKEG